MLGFYNYTVLLTYCGMVTAFAGVLAALNGNLRGALVCLMVSGVCDMFDGRIAATRERTPQEKRFGIQIDSLSDLICFGVLPAVIVCMDGGKTTRVLAAVYLLSALIRLAWFNVTEEERQNGEDGPRKTYLGLPVTTAALAFPCLYGLCARFHWAAARLCPALMLVMAAAFLTPFPVKKPQHVGRLCAVLCGAAVVALALVRRARV